MAESSLHFEPAIQLSLQLSVPDASEEERDLLRREYRLIQAASAFWTGFDSLNARIHGMTDIVQALRAQIEGVPVVPPLPLSLLASLDAAPAEPARPSAASRTSQLSSPRVAASHSAMTWAALAAAVLGLLTLLFLRRNVVKAPLRRVATTPAAAPAIMPPPAPAMPSQAGDSADGLRRQTVPAPEDTPSQCDPVREEMDHALDLAEVMLSYGRTTGAMQTLKDCLHGHPAVSVRPWLKLLDLHRQTGMREDFDRAAETVHRHFNVKVPGWDEGVSDMPLRSFFGEDEGIEILGLEQLPHILAKIQATWPEASCLEYLSHLLVDNRGGGRMGFPVSVVAEILLLEDILNDRLAGHA